MTFSKTSALQEGGGDKPGQFPQGFYSKMLLNAAVYSCQALTGLGKKWKEVSQK